MPVYQRRLKRLLKIIEIKLANVKSPLDFDIVLNYPDGRKPSSTNSEFKVLMATIEGHFKNADGDAFTAMLKNLMAEKKIKAYKLYSTALIEKSYFYQILTGKHIPSRDTVMRIALALKLNTDESKRLLDTLGFCFFEKSRRDIIIMVCVEYRAGLYTTELLLNKYGEAPLCNKSILLRDRE